MKGIQILFRSPASSKIAKWAGMILLVALAMAVTINEITAQNGEQPRLRSENRSSENEQFIGIVKSGKLQLLWPAQVAGSSVQLTGIAMAAAQTPESKETALSKHEGKAIMVQGHYGGQWLYSAKVIDQAGPMQTVLVQQVFDQEMEKK